MSIDTFDQPSIDLSSVFKDTPQSVDQYIGVGRDSASIDRLSITECRLSVDLDIDLVLVWCRPSIDRAVD